MDCRLRFVLIRVEEGIHRYRDRARNQFVERMGQAELLRSGLCQRQNHLGSSRFGIFLGLVNDVFSTRMQMKYCMTGFLYK